MAQNDLIISNQLFPATRQDINDAFESVATQQSGATEPATKYAYQTYADTTNGVLKRRNSLNTDYLIRDTLSDTLVDAKTTTYTVISSDFSKFLTLDTTTGDATINLPPASTVGAGFYIDFQKIVNINEVIIDPDSTETINGQSTYTVFCKDSGGRIICNGSNWNLLLTPGPVLYEYEALSADISLTDGALDNVLTITGLFGRKYQLSYSILCKTDGASGWSMTFQIEQNNDTYSIREVGWTGLDDDDDSYSLISDNLIFDMNPSAPTANINLDIIKTGAGMPLTVYGDGTTRETYLGLLDVSDTHRAGDLDA
jgi:hypothetical protein